MVKKSAVLATLVVATVLCCASQAQAGWPVVWGIQRWHNHYADQGHFTAGHDYASFPGHGCWGAKPRHWAFAMAVSARPWPPMVDKAFAHRKHGKGGGHFGGHFGGGHFGKGFGGGHGRRHKGGHHGHHDASFGSWGGDGYDFSGDHGWDAYGAAEGSPQGYGEGEVPAEGAGPNLYDPGVPGEPRILPKDGELVEPPMGAPPKEPLLKEGAKPTTTKLVLNVPANAKVILAGIDTQSSGAVREFVTTLLNNNAWTDYSVRVEVQHEGQMVVEERTVTLRPGDEQQLTVNFDLSRVASK